MLLSSLFFFYIATLLLRHDLYIIITFSHLIKLDFYDLMDLNKGTGIKIRRKKTVMFNDKGDRCDEETDDEILSILKKPTYLSVIKQENLWSSLNSVQAIG